MIKSAASAASVPPKKHWKDDNENHIWVPSSTGIQRKICCAAFYVVSEVVQANERSPPVAWHMDPAFQTALASLQKGDLVRRGQMTLVRDPNRISTRECMRA